MKAKLKTLFSTDVDLAAFEPDDPSYFGIPVTLMIGPDSGAGEESFEVFVCTPSWLLRAVEEGGPFAANNVIVLDLWAFDDFAAYVRRTFENFAGDNWGEIASQLALISHWEFENYH